MGLAILIPARLASSRFPGKPLAPICNIPMVIRCAQNAKRTGRRTLVCTEDQLIINTCNYYGIDTILTPKCETGTDRVVWGSKSIDENYIVNLQGDEVQISADQLTMFCDAVEEVDKENTILNGISNLAQDKAFDNNNVKAIINSEGEFCIYLGSHYEIITEIAIKAYT